MVKKLSVTLVREVMKIGDQLVYNKFIANEARKRGLSVSLKNELNQIGKLKLYFDFIVAVREQFTI